MRLAAFGAACLLLSAPASAQAPPDSRWAPWTGCWHVQTDAAQGGPPSRPRGHVCVSADGPGVTITTTPEGAAPMTQHVTADDVARPITDGSCTGSEQSAWSTDGFRLYSRAALTCAAGARRQVSGKRGAGAPPVRHRSPRGRLALLRRRVRGRRHGVELALRVDALEHRRAQLVQLPDLLLGQPVEDQ